MMRTWIVIAISIALVLSFVLVYLLSPDDHDFLAGFDPDEFVTIAAYDVPLDGNRIVDVAFSLHPFKYKGIRTNINQLEIRVNKNISGNFPDYMRDNLRPELFFVPETGTRLNLELRIDNPVYYLTAIPFSIVRIFDYYDDLFDAQVELMICVPMNYEFAD